MPRPTIAEVDLDAVAQNVRFIRSRIGSQCALLPAVKANAYGHGSVAVSLVLQRCGVHYLSVASVEEGLELREAGVEIPILLLGHIPEEDYACAIEYKLTPSVIERPQAIQLNEAARKRGVILPVHVDIDTGMHRLGIDWQEAAKATLWIMELSNLRVTGAWTHFAKSDIEDLTFSCEQLLRFRRVIAAIEEGGGNEILYHMCNSAGCLRLPAARLRGVRPGLITYGLKPGSCECEGAGLKPVLCLKTRVVALRRVPSGDGVGYGHAFVTPRDSLIGTLPIGYHDGFLRRFSNEGFVLVRGRKAPVVGRVCMDQCMIDVTDIPDVRAEDEVVVYGRQGDAVIAIEERALSIDTLPHVMTCSVSSRVRRIYRYRGAEVSVAELRRLCDVEAGQLREAGNA